MTDWLTASRSTWLSYGGSLDRLQLLSFTVVFKFSYSCLMLIPDWFALSLTRNAKILKRGLAMCSRQLPENDRLMRLSSQ